MPDQMNSKKHDYIFEHLGQLLAMSVSACLMVLNSTFHIKIALYAICDEINNCMNIISSLELVTQFVGSFWVYQSYTRTHESLTSHWSLIDNQTPQASVTSQWTSTCSQVSKVITLYSQSFTSSQRPNMTSHWTVMIVSQVYDTKFGLE